MTNSYPSILREAAKILGEHPHNAFREDGSEIDVDGHAAHLRNLAEILDKMQTVGVGTREADELEAALFTDKLTTPLQEGK